MDQPKHPGGRPLKFQRVEELQSKIEAYFAEYDREEDTRVFKHDEAIEQDYKDVEKNTVVTRRRIA